MSWKPGEIFVVLLLASSNDVHKVRSEDKWDSFSPYAILALEVTEDVSEVNVEELHKNHFCHQPRIFIRSILFVLKVHQHTRISLLSTC